MTKKIMDDYENVNKNLWNNRTELHINSNFYDIPSFLDGKSSLNSIELDLLGNIKDKSILHLQCHFGQDTLSLARLGAKVVGVDFSENAISEAKKLSKKANIEANFICCNVLELDKFLNDEFDIIFTSYGVLGWLPDLNKWANQIDRFLKVKGKVLLVEFHPVLWMFDEDFRNINYSYSNKQTYIEEIEGTYTDSNSKIGGKAFFWNHGLAEVFNALINNNLSIINFDEYDYSPYNCFKNTIKIKGGYQIKGLEGKLPMVYSLLAQK